MQPAKFVIVSGALGLDQLLIDGTDVTDQVQAVQVQTRPGQPTALMVHLAADGSITGEGIVYIQPERADGGAVARMVRSLDPKEIDAKAMERLDWGSEGTLTAIVLEVIAEKLSES